MTPNISVKRKTGNIHETWVFTFINTTLYLDTYTKAEIVPPKRTGKIIDIYERIYHRNSTMTLDEVILPEDVKKEVTEKFLSLITVKKWDKN
ncbi:MAG: hypothetical protein WCT77_02955 [Bacteroidota bacterium]|jgi:hypothetical protein